MAVQIRVLDQPFIGFPRELGEMFHISDGEEVNISFFKDELRLQKLSEIRKYRGIWQDEDIETIFAKIREGWKQWRKTESA